MDPSTVVAVALEVVVPGASYWSRSGLRSPVQPDSSQEDQSQGGHAPKQTTENDRVVDKQDQVRR